MCKFNVVLLARLTTSINGLFCIVCWPLSRVHLHAFTVTSTLAELFINVNIGDCRVDVLLYLIESDLLRLQLAQT
jgi:hypothetical protein